MKILTLHGINLNMFGKRDPKHYGTNTLADIDSAVKALGKELGAEIEAIADTFDLTVSEVEDALRYDEPSPWMQPVRHALGALLMESGEFREAESVYRADLTRHRENGWALHGLAECLAERGAEAEAAIMRTRFERAWRNADIELGASCFCRRGVEQASASCCED